MIKIDKKDQCTGCGLCKIKCPYNAISFIEDEEGFAYPVVNTEVCTDCGYCERVCIKCKPLQDRSQYTIFAIISKDKEVQKGSSSGGAFSEIAKHVLDRGGCVYGVVWVSPTKARHICVDKIDDLDRLRKSKYVEASLCDELFFDVQRRVQSGVLTLFSGTPCQVMAMRQYVGDHANFITVEVACHGVPSRKIFEEFIKLAEAKYASHIVDVNFRSKYRGWDNFGTEITFENGKKYRKINTIEPYYMRGFLTNMYLRPSCHNCQFKINTSESDFILADYWRIDRKYTEFYDKEGVSLVVAKTDKAMKIIDSIKDNINMIETDSEFAKKVNSVLCCCNKENEKRSEFFQEYSVNGYEKAIKKYCRIGVVNKILTQTGLKPLIRKILGR